MLIKMNFLNISFTFRFPEESVGGGKLANGSFTGLFGLLAIQECLIN